MTVFAAAGTLEEAAGLPVGAVHIVICPASSHLISYFFFQIVASICLNVVSWVDSVLAFHSDVTSVKFIQERTALFKRLVAVKYEAQNTPNKSRESSYSA